MGGIQNTNGANSTNINSIIGIESRNITSDIPQTRLTGFGINIETIPCNFGFIDKQGKTEAKIYYVIPFVNKEGHDSVIAEIYKLDAVIDNNIRKSVFFPPSNSVKYSYTLKNIKGIEGSKATAEFYDNTLDFESKSIKINTTGCRGLYEVSITIESEVVLRMIEVTKFDQEIDTSSASITQEEPVKISYNDVTIIKDIIKCFIFVGEIKLLLPLNLNHFSELPDYEDVVNNYEDVVNNYVTAATAILEEYQKGNRIPRNGKLEKTYERAYHPIPSDMRKGYYKRPYDIRGRLDNAIRWASSNGKEELKAALEKEKESLEKINKIIISIIEGNFHILELVSVVAEVIFVFLPILLGAIGVSVIIGGVSVPLAVLVAGVGLIYTVYTTLNTVLECFSKKEVTVFDAGKIATGTASINIDTINVLNDTLESLEKSPNFTSNSMVAKATKVTKFAKVAKVTKFAKVAGPIVGTIGVSFTAAELIARILRSKPDKRFSICIVLNSIRSDPFLYANYDSMELEVCDGYFKYKVIKDDYVSWLCLFVYGDGTRSTWGGIRKENGDHLDDPDYIRTDQTVRICPLEGYPFFNNVEEWDVWKRTDGKQSNVIRVNYNTSEDVP